jgi:hypothetical protein
MQRLKQKRSRKITQLLQLQGGENNKKIRIILLQPKDEPDKQTRQRRQADRKAINM